MSHPNPNHPPADSLLSLAWRSAPHLYAAEAGGGRWKMYSHLRFIGNRIADAVARGGGRIIVNCPPRCGKSELISHWTPVWFLDNLPHKRVILASYGDALAGDFGRAARNEFESNPRCRVRLRQDSTSAQRWNTPQGGGMIVAGVGGPLSGRGFDLGIIDDPVKNWQEAHSFQSKQVLWEWFHSTFTTRAEPGATVVIAMTRWSEDDLVARLLAENAERWEVISLPALAEEDDLLGRKAGEPLFPARYDVQALTEIRRDVGQAVWDALYQQRPGSLGGNRLYDNFSTENIDDTLGPRLDLPLQLAIDFNINPGMHVLIGQHDPKADLFVVLQEIHGPRMNIRSAMDEFERWLRGRGWGRGSPFLWPELHVFGDASGSGQWAGTSESCYDIVRAKLQAMGVAYRVRILKANPPVRERIDTLNEALRDVENKIHFRLHSRCARLLADFRTQKADADGLPDKRDETLGHSVSAAGYWVHYLRPLRLSQKQPMYRVGVG
jgi:hypothetical protein